MIEDLRKIFLQHTKILDYNIENSKVTFTLLNGLEPQTGKILGRHYEIEMTDEIDGYLKSKEFQEFLFRPTMKGVILIDIVGYSTHDSLQQVALLKIFQNSVISGLKNAHLYSKTFYINHTVPTGDGCYIVFDEALNDRFFRAVFAIRSSFHVEQNKILKEHNLFKKDIPTIEIRVACNICETDTFIDVSGNRNAFGNGMNEVARILEYGKKEFIDKYPGISTDSAIFFGKNVSDQAIKLLKSLNINEVGGRIDIYNLGDVIVKHNVKIPMWCAVVGEYYKYLIIPFDSLKIE